MSTSTVRDIPHWIAGAGRAGTSERTGPVFDPATGAKQAEVRLATAAEVDEAVAAAAAAFASWRNVSVSKRTRIMFAFRALVEARTDELAELISREHGKVLDDARGEVVRGLEVVDFACGIPQLLKGEYSDQVSTDVDSMTYRQPLGVCAGITPFNFPIMVPMWMHPIAIACGNAFVLKPSERDPSVSNLVAEMYAEAGLPDGVFNVVHGDKVAVDALLDSPGVDAVSFVGSTPIARYVHERATAAGKRVQALGGAKNHAVVLPDCDLDFAASQLTAAAFGSAGQRCMAISVAVAVGEPTADALVEKLTARVRELRIGTSFDETADFGPLITPQARDRVDELVGVGVDEGAQLLVDGRGHRPAGNEDGFFTGASLFDHVRTDMRIYQEEVFGPVLSVVRAADYDEAVQLPSENEYGNGVAIFTRDGDAAREFTSRVNTGMVGVNVPIPVPIAYHTFGGWKRSGFGDLNQHGPDSVRFYTATKTVTSRWPSGLKEEASFTIPTMS